jgi:hypothetical protein
MREQAAQIAAMRDLRARLAQLGFDTTAALARAMTR